MKKQYIVAIDLGSQSAKVAIFDLEGHIVCQGRQGLRPMHLAEPVVVEHPDDDLWDALCLASRRAMSIFPGAPEDIIGIGVGSIRCCRVLLKKDGSLAAPVISWMDQRVSRPYEHTDPSVAWVTSTSGYLTHRLTGEFRDNIGNYYGQWPVDYSTWQWSGNAEVLEQYGIPRSMLFNTSLPGTVLGLVTAAAAEATGLPAGVPVAGTTSDKAVEALGAGLTEESRAVISLGTYITMMVTGDQLPSSPETFWAIMSSIPHRYLFESYGIRRGMWTVSWFRDLLGEELTAKALKLGISPEEYLDRLAEENAPPGCDGLLTVLDWLANPWEPHRRGIMIGFNAHMDAAYLFRSILEGIAMTMKNNWDRVHSELGRDLKEIVLSGGGSNSDLFMQIFADVFNLPARRNLVNSSAATGAAINTAVAVGAFSGYEEAVAQMVRVRDVFHPIPEHVAVYQSLNREVYRHLPRQTEEILKKTHEIVTGQAQPDAVINGWGHATGSRGSKE